MIASKASGEGVPLAQAGLLRAAPGPVQPHPVCLGAHPAMGGWIGHNWARRRQVWVSMPPDLHNTTPEHRRILVSVLILADSGASSSTDSGMPIEVIAYRYRRKHTVLSIDIMYSSTRYLGTRVPGYRESIALAHCSSRLPENADPEKYLCDGFLCRSFCACTRAGPSASRTYR